MYDYKKYSKGLGIVYVHTETGETIVSLGQ